MASFDAACGDAVKVWCDAASLSRPSRYCCGAVPDDCQSAPCFPRGLSGLREAGTMRRSYWLEFAWQNVNATHISRLWQCNRCAATARWMVVTCKSSYIALTSVLVFLHIFAPVRKKLCNANDHHTRRCTIIHCKICIRKAFCPLASADRLKYLLNVIITFYRATACWTRYWQWEFCPHAIFGST